MNGEKNDDKTKKWNGYKTNTGKSKERNKDTEVAREKKAEDTGLRNEMYLTFPESVHMHSM